MAVPSSDDVKERIKALETGLASHAENARQAAAELATLEERRLEAEGRLSLAHRAEADHRRRLEEHRAALAEAEQREAREAFVEAVAHRDATAVHVADLFKRVVDGLEELDRLRGVVAAAAAAAREREANVVVPAEPDVFDEEWGRVVDAVRARIGSQLEDAAVDAAARSPGGRAIQDLPHHLRELAKTRRRAFMRERLAGQREEKAG